MNIFLRKIFLVLQLDGFQTDSAKSGMNKNTQKTNFRKEHHKQMSILPFYLHSIFGQLLKHGKRNRIYNKRKEYTLHCWQR